MACRSDIERELKKAVGGKMFICHEEIRRATGFGNGTVDRLTAGLQSHRQNRKKNYLVSDVAERLFNDFG